MNSLLRRPYLKTTVSFALATLATLFTWYGLATWLPELMREDTRFGFDANPLTFLLALSLGAVAGSALTAWAATRIGPLRCTAYAAAGAATALAYLLSYPTSATAVYAALLVAGVGTHGTQCLLLAAIASAYPTALRAGALGFALGVGRVGAVAAPQVAGWLLGAGLGVGSNLLLFAGAAALAALWCVVSAGAVKERREKAADCALRRDVWA